MFFFGYCRSKNGSARDEVKGPPHEILPVAFGDFLGSGEQYIVASTQRWLTGNNLCSHLTPQLLLPCWRKRKNTPWDFIPWNSFNYCGILPSRLSEKKRYLNPWSTSHGTTSPPPTAFPEKNENASSPLQHLGFHRKEAMTALSPPLKYSIYALRKENYDGRVICPKKPDSQGLVYSLAS